VDDPRFTFVRSNFRYLQNWMRYYGEEHIDGLLADLGVSSHHFDDSERGFSFRFRRSAGHAHEHPGLEDGGGRGERLRGGGAV
jgi:hypothetical protein